MKRLALRLGLCLLLSLATPSTRAQDGNASADDASAVQATVRNYIESYYQGDARRMAQTLHPHYLKHMIHGTIPMREKTGQEMLREVRSHGPADLPEADKTEQISVLDVAGSIASAELVTSGWVDYRDAGEVGREVEDSFRRAAHRQLMRQFLSHATEKAKDHGKPGCMNPANQRRRVFKASMRNRSKC